MEEQWLEQCTSVLQTSALRTAALAQSDKSTLSFLFKLARHRCGGPPPPQKPPSQGPAPRYIPVVVVPSSILYLPTVAALAFDPRRYRSEPHATAEDVDSPQRYSINSSLLRVRVEFPAQEGTVIREGDQLHQRARIVGSSCLEEAATELEKDAARRIQLNMKAMRTRLHAVGVMNEWLMDGDDADLASVEERDPDPADGLEALLRPRLFFESFPGQSRRRGHDSYQYSRNRLTKYIREVGLLEKGDRNEFLDGLSVTDIQAYCAEVERARDRHLPESLEDPMVVQAFDLPDNIRIEWVPLDPEQTNKNPKEEDQSPAASPEQKEKSRKVDAMLSKLKESKSDREEASQRMRQQSRDRELVDEMLSDSDDDDAKKQKKRMRQSSASPRSRRGPIEDESEDDADALNVFTGEVSDSRVVKNFLKHIDARLITNWGRALATYFALNERIAQPGNDTSAAVAAPDGNHLAAVLLDRDEHELRYILELAQKKAWHRMIIDPFHRELCEIRRLRHVVRRADKVCLLDEALDRQGVVSNQFSTPRDNSSNWPGESPDPTNPSVAGRTPEFLWGAAAPTASRPSDMLMVSTPRDQEASSARASRMRPEDDKTYRSRFRNPLAKFEYPDGSSYPTDGARKAVPGRGRSRSRNGQLYGESDEEGEEDDLLSGGSPGGKGSRRTSRRGSASAAARRWSQHHPGGNGPDGNEDPEGLLGEGSRRSRRASRLDNPDAAADELLDRIDEDEEGEEGKGSGGHGSGSGSPRSRRSGGGASDDDLVDRLKARLGAHSSGRTTADSNQTPLIVNSASPLIPQRSGDDEESEEYDSNASSESDGMGGRRQKKRKKMRGPHGRYGRSSSRAGGRGGAGDDSEEGSDIGDRRRSRRPSEMDPEALARFNASMAEESRAALQFAVNDEAAGREHIEREATADFALLVDKERKERFRHSMLETEVECTNQPRRKISTRHHDRGLVEEEEKNALRSLAAVLQPRPPSAQRFSFDAEHRSVPYRSRNEAPMPQEITVKHLPSPPVSRMGGEAIGRSEASSASNSRPGSAAVRRHNRSRPSSPAVQGYVAAKHRQVLEPELENPAASS